MKAGASSTVAGIVVRANPERGGGGSHPSDRSESGRREGQAGVAGAAVTPARL